METLLTGLCDQISLRIDEGAMLPMVEEELIEPATDDEDERAALWLFAWSYAKRGQRSSRPREPVA